MKFFLLIFFFISSLYSANCDGYIDLGTSSYSSECASNMLNIPESDYNSIMGTLGGLTGLVFLSFVIYIILHIGRSYRL